LEEKRREGSNKEKRGEERHTHTQTIHMKPNGLPHGVFVEPFERFEPLAGQFVWTMTTFYHDGEGKLVEAGISDFVQIPRSNPPVYVCDSERHLEMMVVIEAAKALPDLCRFTFQGILIGGADGEEQFDVDVPLNILDTVRDRNATGSTVCRFCQQAAALL
jgi:hypothetical protein